MVSPELVVHAGVQERSSRGARAESEKQGAHLVDLLVGGAEHRQLGTASVTCGHSQRVGGRLDFLTQSDVAQHAYIIGEDPVKVGQAGAHEGSEVRVLVPEAQKFASVPR